MPSNYKKIAEEHRQGYGSYDHHLEGYEDFYSDDTHFIYELLQNAQDAIATSPDKATKRRFLKIILRHEDLIAYNDGLPFAEKHVKAICSIRQSTKDLGQIGAHGIGFKSVGKFTATPEIYSGDEQFRIHRRVEPQLVEDIPLPFCDLVESGYTVFRLPFKEGLLEEDLDRLGDRLANIHKWALLFLHDLCIVEWEDERRGISGWYSCDREPHSTIPNAAIARVRSAINGEECAVGTFLCVSQQKLPPQSIINELCRQAKTDKERTSILASSQIPQPIEVAFALRENELDSIDGSILFAFLPTRKETHLRFLMQAHYKTTFARDDIRDLDNSPWNRWLVEETAAFIPDVLCYLKTAKLWIPRAFDILPVPSDDIPDGEGKANVLQPLLKVTLQALTERELIPTTKEGVYAKPARVFHPHSRGLRRLITENSLSELTGVESATWLHSDLSWDGRAGEMLKAVGVKEVKAKNVVDWLETKNAEWFQTQKDAWLSELYVYLASPALKAERERVKRMFLVRQEDGSNVCAADEWVFFQTEDEQQRQHLAPFLADLPAFKMSLLMGDEREQIKSFLTDIGVKPFKPVSLIGEWFLPKYKSQEPFTPDENRAHVCLLINILDSLTESELKELRSRIKEIPFLRAQKGYGRSIKGYARPDEAYLPKAFTLSGDLDTYLGADSPYWLIDDFYLEGDEEREKWLEALKKLGVAILPRCRATTKDAPSVEDRARIKTKYGYIGEVTSSDDQFLDGLDNALSRIQERKGDVHATSVALWRLLAHIIPLEDHKRKDFLYGKCSWKHRSSSYQDAFPFTFYKQLTQTAWIPDAVGGFHTPQSPDLFAPDTKTRQILGNRVQYLHPDLAVGEQTSKSRNVAVALDINLTANIPTVLRQLKAMSGSSVDVKEVARMYQFLLSRVITEQKSQFAENFLIYTPLPEPRWWKSGDVFWENEDIVFGNDRGYLETFYPDLKTFFTLIDVSLKASFPDYVRAMLELASQGDVTSNTLRRVRVLYQKLWTQSLGGADAQGQSLQEKERATKQLALWQQLLASRCWLAVVEERWEWHRHSQIFVNDHDNLAELFSDDLPFWKHPGLDDLARFVEMPLVSQAYLTFTPTGERSECEEWAFRVHGLKEYLACFLHSPRLAPDACDLAVLNILDNLHVVLVAGSEVTYTLHGVTVPDPEPRLSYLEVGNGAAKIWITQEAVEKDYPVEIGDALAQHWRIEGMSAFISELLSSDDRARVLTRWQKKGLRYERPANSSATEEQDETQAEKTDNDFTSQDAATSTKDGENRGTSQEERIGNRTGEDTSEDTTGKLKVSGQWRQSGRYNQNRTGYGGYGGGPEGEIHKGLKQKIRAELSLITLGLQFVDEEYEIASGQAGSKVDLLLKDAEGKPVCIEVKPHVQPGEYTVIWQAVRYKHLLAVERNLKCDAVRCFLVAPKIPQDVKLKCELMGIEYREITL